MIDFAAAVTCCRARHQTDHDWEKFLLDLVERGQTQPITLGFLHGFPDDAHRVETGQQAAAERSDNGGRANR